jgi:hypothetical protein
LIITLTISRGTQNPLRYSDDIFGAYHPKRE